MTEPPELNAAAAQHRDSLREIINDLIARRAAGETIADESLIEQHPELMPELADELRNLRIVERAEQDAQSVKSGLHLRCPHCHNPVELVDDASLSEVLCPSCGSQFSLVDDADRTYQARSEQMIGHFQLLDKVGMGAFGSVWSARDTELDRQVAVKIPRKGQLSVEDGELFIREARAAAQLKHPHIVSVLEVGRHEDRIYIVTEFVQGLDLADWLTDQQAAPREAAELCATLANALQHAHSHGVIHRDLKPSNIMLDTDGEPHLMDFGLAKRESGEMTMTVEGKLLGTPAYMSPEQARGAAHDADARSDVYSMGVILFEMLTGERPFRGSTRMLLHQVLVEDAPSPRKLNGGVPRDLETICSKCLEKAPDRRYQTAAELRDDLCRFLAGQPVLARPITKIARGWRWCTRMPVVASLGATVACLLLFLGISGPIVALKQKSLATKEIAARREAEDARSDAEDARKSLRRQLYIADMSRAQQAIQRSHVSKVIDLLELHQPLAGEEDLRGFEWYYLWAACQRTIMQPTIEGGDIRELIYSRDGQTMIYADTSHGQVIHRDTKTLAERKTVHFNNEGLANPEYIKLSPDGNFAALELANHKDIRLIDLSTREESVLSGHTDTLDGLVFSPDGKMLACGDFSGSVILWNVTTGQQILEFKERTDRKAHGERVTDVAFSPDGQTIATGSRDQTAKLWEVATGKLLATFETEPHTDTKSNVYAVAFSPDGKMLATGTSGDFVVLLWDVVDRRHIGTLHGHSDYVHRLAFSDDGKKLASTSIVASVSGRTAESLRWFSGTIWVWDAKTGEPLDSFSTTLSSVTGHNLSFSPDGSTLAITAKDGGVGLWQLSDPANPCVRVSPDDWEKGVVDGSPDGTTLVIGTSSLEGRIEVWDMTTDAVIRQFSHGAPVRSVAWNEGRREVVSCGVDGRVKLWNSDTRELLKTLEHESNDSKYNRVQLLSDSDTLVVTSDDLNVYSWDLAATDPQRKVLHSHDLDRPVLSFLAWVHPGGQLLETLVEEESGERLTELWDIATNQVIQRFPYFNVRDCALSVDGSLFAIGTEDGEVILWDMAGKKELLRLTGHEGWVWSVCFSPDGRRLFAGDQKTVKLWDVATGTLQFELEAHTDNVRGIHITPDTRTLTTVSTDSTIKQWRAASEDEVQQMRQRWNELQ